MFTVGIHAFYNYSDNDIKFTYHKCHFQSSYSCSLHISNRGATQARPSWKAFRFFWKKNKRISQNLIDGTTNLCAKPKISLSLFDCDLYKGTKLFLTGLINAIFVESKKHSERTATEVIHCYQSNSVSWRLQVH